MTPEMEAAVLNESEQALKELIEAFLNVGLSRSSISFMLRTKADDISKVLELPN